MHSKLIGSLQVHAALHNYILAGDTGKDGDEELNLKLLCLYRRVYNNWKYTVLLYYNTYMSSQSGRELNS